MTTLDRIKNLLEDQDVLGDVELTMDTTFEDLDLDSLALVDLTMNCEEEFDIELDTENTPKTVGELVEKIQELTGAED